MTIAEFAKVYGVSKREIDYWTSINLLHPIIRANGYRDYGERAEEEIKVILVAMMLDYPGPIERKCKMLNDLNDDKWRSILNKISNKRGNLDKQYTIAYNMVINKIKR